jgi:hypothetical protein
VCHLFCLLQSRLYSQRIRKTALQLRPQLVLTGLVCVALLYRLAYMGGDVPAGWCGVCAFFLRCCSFCVPTLCIWMGFCGYRFGFVCLGSPHGICQTDREHPRRVDNLLLRLCAFVLAGAMAICTAAAASRVCTFQLSVCAVRVALGCADCGVLGLVGVGRPFRVCARACDGDSWGQILLSDA